MFNKKNILQDLKDASFQSEVMKNKRIYSAISDVNMLLTNRIVTLENRVLELESNLKDGK